MADKGISIGHMTNVTGMIGVSAGIVLLAFGLVLLLFRRGFGFDIAIPHLVLVAAGAGCSAHLQSTACGLGCLITAKTRHQCHCGIGCR